MADDQYSDLSIRNLRSTMQIMKQATSSYTSNIVTFLFLSHFIYSFRTSVEYGTKLVITIFDTEPSLKTPQQFHFPRNPLPFHLRLTRVGTSRAGLFSSEEEADPFPHEKSPHNGSSVLLHGHYGAADMDNGSQTPVMARSDQNQVKEVENNGTEIDLGEVDDDGDNEKENKEREEIEKLNNLLKTLPGAYFSLVFCHCFTYSLGYGIIFHTVVSNLIRRNTSFMKNIFRGSSFGFKRVIWFLILRWAARESSTHLVAMFFIKDDNLVDLSSLLKLLMKLKMIPLSLVFPWIHEFSKENSGFFFTWWLFDSVLALVFVLGGWVTIVNSIEWFMGKQIVQESSHLVWSMLNHAIIIKCFEDLICGSGVRSFFTRVLGKELALALQIIFEVYFMVVWLIVYLVAKCRDVATSEDGRRFGRRELNSVFDSLNR